MIEIIIVYQWFYTITLIIHFLAQ